MKHKCTLLFLLVFLLPVATFAAESENYILEKEGVISVPSSFLSDDFSLEGGVVFFEGQERSIFLTDEENAEGAEEDSPVHSSPTEPESSEKEIEKQTPASSGGSSGGGWRRSVDSKRGLAQFQNNATSKPTKEVSAGEKKSNAPQEITSPKAVEEYEDLVHAQGEMEKDTIPLREKKEEPFLSSEKKKLPSLEKQKESEASQKFVQERAPSREEGKKNQENILRDLLNKKSIQNDSVFSGNDRGGIRTPGEVFLPQKKEGGFAGESYDPLAPRFALEKEHLHAAPSDAPQKTTSFFLIPLVLVGLFLFVIWRREQGLYPWKRWRVGKR